MSKLFLLIIPFLFCLTSCSSVQKKQNKALSTAIHGARESIKQGRIDIAKSLLDEAARLVPPPKKKIVIHPFKWNTVGLIEKDKVDLGTNFIVLPPELAARPVIVKDSKEFNEILNNNKELLKTEKANNKLIDKLEKDVDNVIREKEKIVEKAEKKSWFSKLFGWGLGLGIGGLLLTVGVIIFFPAAIPLIFTVLGNVFQGINFVLKWVLDRFRT